MDYNQEYNNYWSAKDRLGESSFQDPETICNSILSSCGYCNTLDIGCGMGQLVKMLLSKGCDAYGLDISDVAIRECQERINRDRFIQGSILKLPYQNDSFETIISTDCLEHLDRDDVVEALNELYRVTKRNLYLIIATTQDRDGHWHLTVEKRTWWEEQLKKAGFRKHPNYYDVVKYEELNDDTWQISILVEKINAFYDLDDNNVGSINDAILHDDMLNRFDRRSDGHCIRYVKALEYIGKNDTVLDMACGLGYGSHIIYNNSMAKKIIGIDICQDSIDYANKAYGNDVIEYRVDDAETLNTIQDNSIDFIVSFETIEHVKNPREYLKQLNRVLKPSGRMLISAPNDWTDETGKDPNPYHFHVYTRNKLFEECSEFFLVEKEFGQTAGGAMKCHFEGRSWRELDVSKRDGVSDEWVLLLAMKTPLDNQSLEYQEHAWNIPQIQEFSFLNFKNDYINPWLLKSMVLIGKRSTSLEMLRGFRSDIMQSYPTDSCDYGAALCGLIYDLKHAEFDEHGYEDLKSKVTAYLKIRQPNPHQIRWQISLMFALGDFAQQFGKYEDAYCYYKLCTEIDPCKFSVTLGNKAIDSLFRLAIFDINNDQIGIARKHLLESIQLAISWVQGDNWLNIIGGEDSPLPEGLAELTQIFDKVTRASYLLNVLDLGRLNTPLLFQESAGYFERIQNDLQNNLTISKENIIKLSNESHNYVKNIIKLQAQVIEQSNLTQQQAEEVTRLDARAKELANQVIEQSNLAQQQAEEVMRLDARTKELAAQVIEQSNLAQQQAAEVSRLYNLCQLQEKQITSKI